MKLMTLHRVLIVAAIVLCVLFAARTVLTGDRQLGAVGVMLPLVIAAGLVVYLVRLRRRS